MPFACVHVPRVAVQAALREHFGSGEDAPPLALFRRTGERRVVTAASVAALESGVRPGMTVSAGEGACPDLVAVEENPAVTVAALASLADALFVFGPVTATAIRLPNQEVVTLGDAVLVDVTRVHGVVVTVSALLGAASALGFSAQAAIAETPWAALALASAGGTTKTGAASEVGPLSLAAARLPETAYTALQLVGIRTVGALLALPVAGLERRFGSTVGAITRVLRGSAQAQLVPYEPTPLIAERMRIEEGTADNLESLGFRIKGVTDRVVRRLVGRGLGAEALQLELDVEFHHDLTLGEVRRAGSRKHILELELGHPHQDAALLRDLIQDRLASLPPPGPVTAVTLRVLRTSSSVPAQLGLFDDPPPRETIAATAARLASLLGDDRIAPELAEDFRPERAYALRAFRPPRVQERGRRAPAPASSGAAPPPGPRPTRLFREPEPLGSSPLDGVANGGAVSGPERLVSGWWDDAPMARDYFVIADRWGRRSWVFRDLGTNRWFRHGVFD